LFAALGSVGAQRCFFADRLPGACMWRLVRLSGARAGILPNEYEVPFVAMLGW